MNVLSSPLLPFVESDRQTSKRRSLLITVGILAFMLSCIPKLRIVVGVPLYVVDFVILYLLVKTGSKRQIKHRGFARALVGLLSYYLGFVVLGELHGGLVYNMPLEAGYTLFRVCMAISLTYILPRQIRNLQELKVVIKGLCLGLLLSAFIAICYSLPVTRGLTDALFSIKMLAPDGDQIVGLSHSVYDASFDGNYRGRTLLGASTFSSGVMAMLWPLVFMGSVLLPAQGGWKYINKFALVLLPLGILATYGRSAWLSVVLVMASGLLWGSTRGRVKLLLGILLAGLLIAPFGIGIVAEKLPLVNRLVQKTQVTIEYGAEKESEAERFLAYVEPFEHVTKYPSFLFVGSGAAQRKWGGNAYREAELASHAIPAMSYYAYGVGGAACQIGFMFVTFRLISRRLQQARQHLRRMTWIWRSLLGCWFGLLPWWCFGHGIVTAPRGAMVFFFFLGILLACDQIFTMLCVQADNSQHSLPLGEPSQL